MKKRAPPAVKPKVKEAEKVVFHKFPQPEQYRNRRIRVREAVVAASDSPDKAHAWLGKVWEKDASETELRDPGGLALWTHNTVFIPDTRGEVETYLAWCALDHLHGRCIVYVNEELFDRRVFRQALTAQEFSWMSRKGWGRNKSKTLATVGNVTRDDALNPEGSFMEQIGLAKGEGKGKRKHLQHDSRASHEEWAPIPHRGAVLGLY